MIHIEVTNVGTVTAKLQALPEQIRQQAVNGLAQTAYDAAFRMADKHTRTAALIRSLFMRRIDDGWEIGHDLQQAQHAVFVHWGSRPHPIGPRKDNPRTSRVRAHSRGGHAVKAHDRHITRQYLRWPSGTGGATGFAFAHFVERHPGYKGDPWLVKAGKEAVDAFDGIVSKLQGNL